MIAVHRLRSQEKKAAKGLRDFTLSGVETVFGSSALLDALAAAAGTDADASPSLRARKAAIQAAASFCRASASSSCVEGVSRSDSEMAESERANDSTPG